MQPNETEKFPEDDLTYEQRELYEAMSDISEISYCAGWNGGNEDRVWQLLRDNGGSYGMVAWRGDEHELERVRRCMVAADSWIVWRGVGTPASGPYAVPLAEWVASKVGGA